ncbi:MAG: VWA domain-containing protein, partial [Desulfobacteraceae bacterium]|nr:VWA domain-containing protein [Desulfobacteraceae bacterium]
MRYVLLGEEGRTTFSPGEQTKIYTRVKNIGGADSDHGIRIEYYQSDREKIDAKDKRIYISHDDIDEKNLTKGHSGYEEKFYTVPTTPGTYNITVIADTEDKVDEENEGNNKFDPPFVFEVIDPNAAPADQGSTTQQPEPVSVISGIDTALIIDSSGSMSDNDPKNYRLEVARFFIDRSEDSDSVTVVDFDFGVFVDPERGYLRNAKDSRTALKEAVNQINSDGGTNISIGLTTAYDQLNSGYADTPKIAILLTDGNGDYNNEASLYQAKGWKIFTIGLSDDVDEALLRKIASDTGGEYFKVTTEEAARNAITQIYQMISRSVHAVGQIMRQEQFKVSLGETVER